MLAMFLLLLVPDRAYIHRDVSHLDKLHSAQRQHGRRQWMSSRGRVSKLLWQTVISSYQRRDVSGSTMLS